MRPPPPPTSAYLMDGRAPEVVLEHVRQRSVRPDVPVLFDGDDVVVDEVSRERGQVDEAGHGRHEECPLP